MTGTLVIGPAWIGDMVLAHSLFQVLKRSAPGRRLAVAAPPWTLPLLRFIFKIIGTNRGLARRNVSHRPAHRPQQPRQP